MKKISVGLIIASVIIDSVKNRNPIVGIIGGHGPSQGKLGSGMDLSKDALDHSKVHHLQDQVNKTDSNNDDFFQKITQKLIASTHISRALPATSHVPLDDSEDVFPIDQIIFEKVSAVSINSDIKHTRDQEDNQPKAIQSDKEKQ